METNNPQIIDTQSKIDNPPKKDYVIYILVNTLHNRTYVGITNNPNRRIRQHNGELVGGAKYTKTNKGDGTWKFYGFIRDLDKRTALSYEKRIQLKSRKMSGTPIERRLKAINLLLGETEYRLDIL